MDVTTPALDLTIYPESDGQPMTESDATRDYLIYCVEVLRLYFQSRRHVYVSGNLFVYYEQGNSQAVVSPDVFVVFGVGGHKRRSYQAWREGGKLPSFVIEITSSSTKQRDEVEKPALYARLGVQEYFQYDPTADYLNPPLKGATLVAGAYQPLPLQTDANGIPFISSRVLGLDLQLRPASGLQRSPALRFYDPQAELLLLSLEETEQARTEAERAKTEAERARTEAEQARTEAERARTEAEQRAERLAAQLRALGIEPDAAD